MTELQAPTPLAPPPAIALPPTSLPTFNLVVMVVWGLVLQALSSSAWSFAAVGWVALLPLLVLARAGSAVVAVFVVFAVAFVGRAIGLVSTGAEDVAVVGAAGAAVGVVVVATVHRLTHRALPMLGTLGAAGAVVVVEYLGQALRVPAARELAVSAAQAGDPPLFWYVDVVTPLGISFVVVWMNAVLAGYGELFLAIDPIARARRERGLFLQTAACFAVVVVAHVVGAVLVAAGADVVGEGTHVDVIAAIAAIGLFALVVMAVKAERARALDAVNR